MDSIIRAAFMYFFLLVVFRIAGRRTLGEMSTFDFILLLIVSEATQQAMIDSDNSITNSVLIILTLVGLSTLLSLFERRFKGLDKMVNGIPTVIVENGKIIKDRANKARIEEGEILTAARQTQGLERMDQIKYAVLERSGAISIIPMESN